MLELFRGWETHCGMLFIMFVKTRGR